MPIPIGVLAQAGAGGASVIHAFDHLETVNLTTTTASVTFSNLGNYSAYRHLQVRAVFRNDANVSVVGALLSRLNGDTGNNYTWHFSRVSNTTPAVVNSGSGDSRFFFLSCVPEVSTQSNAFGLGVFDFLEFNSTSKLKTVGAHFGLYADGSNSRFLAVGGALWNSTSAISSILLYPEFGSFIAGTRFSLYGIKA